MGICTMTGKLRSVLIGVLLAGQWLVATGALAAITISPSPSTGDYTVSWSAPAASSLATKLHEKVGEGTWTLVGTYASTVTSKSYTGKAAGTYSYKTEQCFTGFGSTSCWDSEGPTSVTVSTAPPPAPTASISWDPDTVDYGASSTLTWSSTDATSCTINGATRATSGSWVGTNRTRTTTTRLVCTGPGGTSDEATATLTVNPPPAPTASISWDPDTVDYGDSSTLIWSSTDATSCTINGATRATSGSWETTQTRTRTFRLVCTGPGGTSDTASATLTVRPQETEAEEPDAPARPNISEGDEQLTVSWTEPDDNGAAITRYGMHYKASGATSWTTHSLANAGTSTSTTITGLTNGTTYLLQVRAHNAVGPSAFSATARGTPRDEPDAPAKPALTPGNTQLSVSWTAPDGNGASIDEYEVEHKRNVASVTTWSERTVTGTSATLTGLTNGLEYVVRVRAHNEAGWSGWSATATARPALVPTLSVAPATSTDGAYTVSWGIARCFSVPFGGGRVCRVLQERAGESGSWAAVSGIAETATSHNVTGKASGTYYYRLVIGTGASALVVGGPVNVTVAEPEDEEPDAPARPNIAEGDEQLTVSWTAPDDNGAVIDDYDVRYRRTGATSWRTHSFSGTGTRTTISSNLVNGVEYEVQVRAHNDEGESDWSKSGKGTPRDEPDAPAKPTVATGTGQLTVSWEAPDNNGDAIDEYEVEYKRNTASVTTWRERTVTGTRATLGSLSNGREYAVRVKAHNEAGWSGNSTAATGTPLAAPGTPTGPAASTGTHTVSWGAVTGAAEYELQARRNGGSWASAGTVTETSDEFTSVASGSWDYQVRACNTGGCGNWSSSLTVTVGSGLTLTVLPETSTDGAYTVDWGIARCFNAPFGGGPVCWVLQERVGESGNWTVVTGIAATATSLSVTGKALGTYSYRLVIGAGASAVVVAGPASVTVAPPPTTLTASVSWDPETADHGGSSTLSWRSTEATSCELDGTAAALSGSRVENNLTADRTSTLTCTGDGDETASASATVTVRPPAPDAPAAPTGPSASTGTHTLSWSAVTGATQYEVQARVDDGAWAASEQVTATSRRFTGVAAGIWDYQVQACNAGGCSDWSDTKTVVVGTGLTIAPSPSPDGAYTVSWTGVRCTVNFGQGLNCRELQERAGRSGSWTTVSGIANHATSHPFNAKTPETYYYRLVRTQNGAQQVADGPAVVTVSEPPEPALTATISWDPESVDYGGSSTLSWRSTEATSCELDGSSATLSGSSEKTNLTANRTSTLTCTGEDDETASASATVTVSPTAPAVPAPKVTVGDTRATVSWTAPAANGSAITGYTLRYKRTSATDWTAHSLGATQSSRALEDLDNDIVYEVQVEATNGVGSSGWSTPSTRFTPTAAPVLTLAVSPALSENGDYTVSWSEARCATVAGSKVCRVLQEQVGDGDWTSLSGVAEDATSKDFEDQGVGTYAYRLVTGAGATLAVAAGPVRVEVKVPVPAGLTGPAAEAVTDSYTVSWDTVTSAVHYELQARLDEGDWTMYNTGTATSKAFTGLDAGTWDYQVRACNAAGCSGWSGTLTVTVPLAVPTGLSGPAADAVTDPYTVRWDAVSGATYYELREWLDEGGQPAEADWTVYDTGTTASKAFTGQESGSWDYQVRACNAAGCGDWSGTLTVVVPGFNGVPAAPDPVVTAPGSVVDATARTSLDRIGTLPGEFRVAESGAATYSIPLALPPGTAGVVPPLGLHYNSQRGNGLLGVGWSIDGLSAITRCRQTHGQDRNPTALTFTDADRFCLDGQRLLVTSGSYGAPDSEYKTEIDQFLTVTAKGGSDGHPDYFEVQRKDGSVSTYGDTDAHASEHKVRNLDGTETTKVLTWALQEFKDSADNQIHYVYTDDEYGHRISEVRYAYGGSFSETAQATVRFTYADRDDDMVGYLAGQQLQNTKRLSEIAVEGRDVNDEDDDDDTEEPLTLRTYKLSYAAVPATAAPNQLSRLAGVQECAGASSDCLTKTRFTWSAPTALFNTTSTALTLNGDRSWKPVDFNPADINGDGLADLVWTETKGSKHRLHYALANRTTGQLGKATFTVGGDELEYDDNYGTSNYGDNLRVHTEVVDYNGDGRHDLLVYSTDDDETKLHLAKPQTDGSWKLDGTGTRLFSGRYRYADLNSDGLLDAYKLVALPPAQTGQWAPAGYQMEVRYLERDTTAAVSSDRYYAYGNAETRTINFTPQTPNPDDPTSLLRWQSLETAKVQVADVDGDGRADLVTWGYDSTRQFDLQGGYTTSVLKRLEVFRQTGTGFVRYGAAFDVTPPVAGVVPKGLQVRDLNQDGLSDLVYFIGKWYEKSDDNWQWTGNWHYRLSTGAGFTDATQLTSVDANAQAPSSLSLHDDNGDGHPDLLWHDVPSRKVKLRRWLPSTGAFETMETTVRTTSGEDEEQYFTLDVNGDGNGDLLQVAESGSTETLKTYLQPTAGRPHLITSITNGLEAETAIRYESLGTTDAYTRVDKLDTTATMERQCFSWHGSAPFCWPVPTAQLNAADFYTDLNNPWPGLSDPVTGTMGPPVLELTGPLYVVTQVDSSAPTAANANAKSGIGYVYEQGKVQAAGRGLLGFKSLTTVDLQTGVRTTTTYRQDFPYIGLPLRTEVRTADDKLLRAAVNTWKLVGYQTDDTTTADVNEDWKVRAGMAGSAVLGPLQPYLAKSVEQVRDLPVTDDMGTATTDDDTLNDGPLLTTVTTNTVQDSYGNPTNITVTTQDHANGKRFRQETANTYGTDTDTWAKQYGRLTATTVTRARDEADDGTYETTGSRTSTFSYYTDDDGYKKGLLKTGTRAAIIDEGEDADDEADDEVTIPAHTTTYDYDFFGNRVHARVTAGGETRCWSDTAQYDVNGRYPEYEYDCLGNTRRELWAHNAHGLPTRVKTLIDTDGSTGVETTHTYTAGGRLYFSRDATGAFTGTWRVNCGGTVSCPTGAAHYTETRQAGGGARREYVDVLGRVMRSAVKGFDGTWVNTDTEYDSLGRVSRRSEPYYETPTPTLHWTGYEYDLLGRVVKTVLPDFVAGTGTAAVNSVIAVSYAGRVSTTTNGTGQRQTETRNALDEVIRTADHAGTTVTHAYDAWGQVTKTTVAGTGVSAVTTKMKYDEYGRRKELKDPDRGTITYEYNGFDEVEKQTDAVGNYQELSYDELGRLFRRLEYAPDGPDADEEDELTGDVYWSYDYETNGLGQLNQVSDYQSGYERWMTYDDKGRVDVTETRPGWDDDTYYEKQTYDQYGRPYQYFDAARTSATWDDKVTATQYNDHGYAHKWVDGVQVNGRPKATYRTITAQDARGNVTGEALGAGAIRTTRRFDAKTGRIGSIASKTAIDQERQDLGYAWDVLGNLTERTDMTGTRSLTETFAYDTLNRLTSAQVGTGTAQTLTYDALGNIKTKTGVGSYTYGSGTAAPGPHAVTQAGNNRYSYDANGNVTGETPVGSSTPARTFAYTAFNKVASVTKGNHTTTFAYGPDRARYKRTDTDDKGTKMDATDDATVTTLYVGNVEKVTYSSTRYEYKRTIAGGAALITHEVVTDETTTPETVTETVSTQYLLRDHLGSVSVIVDAMGAVVQELSYDAWGQRRHGTTWGDLTALARMSFDTSRTRRGFTGHEMVDAAGIVHMNGRIYDATLGRFLQADPVIQFPHYSQSYNRYSYVLNNPLAYTDPSGYFIGKLFKKIFRGLNKALGDFAPFVSIALLAIAPVYGWVMQSWVNAFQFGFVTGGIATGSLKGALFGGISGAAFYGIGEHFTAVTGLAEGGVGHILTHGVTGGILAELQGGQFGHGFLAAGLSKAVMGRFSYDDLSAPAVLGRTAIAATVGGTISRITGGKFANGAVTAAMAQLFNAENTARARGVQGSGSFWDDVKRFGQRVWKGLTRWHYEGRVARNLNLPSAVSEADALGGRRAPSEQAVLHNDQVGREEVKIIFDDGREAVYNGDTGELVTNPEYAGTYNYVNPQLGAPWYHPKNVAHGVVDVVPYCIGGNNRAGAGPSCF